MTLSEIKEKFGLRCLTKNLSLEREVKGAYVGDLLSDVMANVKGGYVWITVQVHPNIVAVASLKDICGIILVADREPDSETIAKAGAEGIPILSTALFGFELAGKLFELGIRG